jgi:antitoxin (DNA-binding transcriptional repressor) of toxin-antitoxin stability system
MATIHVQLDEASRDLEGVIERLQDGSEIVIDDGTKPVARLVAPMPAPHVGLLSDSRRIAKERGAAFAPDGQFGDDLEAIVAGHRDHQPRLLSESLRILKERGSSVTLDDEFGDDMEKIIAERDAHRPDPWA